jgi:hypothetical protein
MVMKHGILQAISDCRLRDALRMLEQCAFNPTVEVCHKLVLTAMMDSEGAYAHALEAKVLIHGAVKDGFEASAQKMTTSRRVVCL